MEYFEDSKALALQGSVHPDGRGKVWLQAYAEDDW